ncbi:MAG: metallopeptidase TldD-related protein, partial [Myxococcota bacterium]
MRPAYAITSALVLATTCIPSIAAGQEPPSSAVAALQQEVQRARTLELPGMPRAHHIVATLLGEEETIVEATLGAVVAQDRNRARILKLEVRVGDPSFDSSNFLGVAEEPIVVASTALDNDTEALRRTAWLLADRAYKNATETYEAKRAHVESMAKHDDAVPDFAAAPVQRWVGALPRPVPPAAAYASLAKTISAVFVGRPEIHRSVVRIAARTRTRTLVDSAGTAIEDASSLLRVEIVGWTQADDGMALADHAVVASRRFEDMPAKEQLVSMARSLVSRLERTRRAKVVDDYAGPVLFEGRAAPQLLRFLLANELSATPAPEPSAGDSAAASSSLSARVGWRILPLAFGVVDDPSRDGTAGMPLIGGYRFDDEGVRAQTVAVVADGRLRALLSSRTPSKEFAVSNGHGRSGPVGHARGRVSNLLVSVRGGMPKAALRARLLAAARREGLDYGMIVAGFDEPALTEQAMKPMSAAGGGVVLPRPTEVYVLRA